MAIQTYLLDTSILIAHIRSSNKEATRWIIRSVNDASIRCAVSVLTYYELWRGATDDDKKRQYKAVFSRLRTYAVTREIADIGAKLWLDLPENQRLNKLNSDILIAATAEAHRFPIVTINKKDFKRFGVTVRMITVPNRGKYTEKGDT